MSSEINSIDKIKKVHFIGIGGSGMFPLAQIMKSRGIEVTGSDASESETLRKVRDLDIKVFTTHSKSNIKNPDLVVYSSAIKDSNVELQTAKDKKIPAIKRSYLMGMIFKDYKNSIGVAGTHGKTTTTSMITSILIDAQKSPTAIIGGTLPKINSNCCIGNSDIIVGEACEYDNSFLCLSPSISVITNIDADHLDYFITFENIKKSFNKFASQTQNTIIANGDDDNVRECIKNCDIKKLFFGLSPSSDIYAKNIVFSEKQCASFSVFCGENKLSDVLLRVPGIHNVYNALAAFCLCYEMGIDSAIISESLKNFQGAHRRFEILYNKNKITVADDFAHHPTEIKTTLEAASKMGFNRVWAIFQPHTFSRTHMLLNEFAEALSIADKVVISDILPVRETNIYGVHATDLTNKIPQSIYKPNFEEICEFIIKNVEPNDLVITLGGGNVYECANLIVKALSS